MHGQGYLAETSIGRAFDCGDRVKIVCAVTEPSTRLGSPTFSRNSGSIEDIDYRYAVYLILCLQLRFIRSNERPNVV